MLHLLNKTGDRLEVNALFIQPTRWCRHNCRGCYVKAHQSSSYQTPWPEQALLFNKFLNGEDAYANQITISLDSPADDDTQYEHMIAFFREVIRILEERKKGRIYPQVHLTVRNANVLREYESTIPFRQQDQLWNLFTLISVSSIDDTDILRETVGGKIHINYNHMAPTHINSTNIKKQVERLTDIAKGVQSIYFIAHKSPVGADRNEFQKLLDKTRWRSDILYMRSMLMSLPAHVKRKIQIDGCIEDVVRTYKTSMGCSSNVSRFQIWPDGSVSGCPYAFKGSSGPGTTAGEIIENIREARKTYDYDRCHLPEIHNSLTRRSKDTKQKLSFR